MPKGKHLIYGGKLPMRPPETKVIPYLVAWLFKDGLPRGWGKNVQPL